MPEQDPPDPWRVPDFRSGQDVDELLREAMEAVGMEVPEKYKKANGADAPQAKCKEEPPVIGLVNDGKAPEPLSELNDNYRVVDIAQLIEEVQPEMVHEENQIMLRGFIGDDSHTVTAPGIPIGAILDQFLALGLRETLIASVAEIAPDGSTTDTLIYYALQKKLPLVILAFAHRDMWELGVPIDKLDTGLIKICSPSGGFAKSLGIKAWGKNSAQHRLANGLFLITHNASRDRYRFAECWVAEFGRLPHDLTSIDKRLKTLRAIPQR